MPEYRHVICERCNEKMFQQALDNEAGFWLVVNGTKAPDKIDKKGRYFECPNPNCQAQYDIITNPPIGKLIYRLGTGRK